MAASQVDIITESILVLSMLIPEALAKFGLEPTAVMAVPVLVWRNAHIRKASTAKNRRLPTGMERFPI